MTPHPRRHQRLPAAAGRHPDLRRGAAGPPPAGLGGRARLATPRVGGATTPALPYPGGPAAHAACCCRPGPPPGPPPTSRAGTAATAPSSAPPRRSGCSPRRCATAGVAAPGRRHARPRDRLGGAARVAGSCCSASPATSTCSPTSASTRAAGSSRRSARRTRLAQLSPGVDVDRFTPDADGAAVRRRYGLGDGAGRRLRVPAGRPQGPGRAGGRLAAGARPPSRRAAAPRRRRPGRGVAAPRGRRGWAGAAPSSSPGRWRPTQLPAHYAAGDVFAMPCRTRRAGLDVEGLGIVFLEAAACGLPGRRRHLGRRAGGGAGRRHRPRRRPAVARRRRRRDRGPAGRPGPRPRDGRGRPGLGGAALVVDDDRRDVRRAAREHGPAAARRGSVRQRV